VAGGRCSPAKGKRGKTLQSSVDEPLSWRKDLERIEKNDLARVRGKSRPQKEKEKEEAVKPQEGGFMLQVVLRGGLVKGRGGTTKRGSWQGVECSTGSQEPSKLEDHGLRRKDKLNSPCSSDSGGRGKKRKGKNRVWGENFLGPDSLTTGGVFDWRIVLGNTGRDGRGGGG